MDSLTNRLPIFLGEEQPALLLLLKTLVKTHIATADQLCRLLTLANPEQTITVHNHFIRRLLELKLAAAKTYRIRSGGGLIRTRAQSAKSTGGNPLVPVTIFFLTPNGARAAEELTPGSSSANFAAPGAPVGINADRIYHNLLITEAFIQACRLYDVVDFINENQLKSRIWHERAFHQRINKFLKHPEHTGDFRILYYGADGRLCSFNGEIVLQSKKEQIRSKPKGLVFYTDCRQTADVVENQTGEPAFILKNPLETSVKTEAKNETKPTPRLTKEEQNIVSLFLQIPAALDAGTVGLLLGKPRNKISALLSDLAKKDVFQYAYLQNNVGRPLKIYAPKAVGNLEDLNKRKQFYALTLLLKLLIKTGGEVESFDEANNCLIVKKDEYKRRTIVLDSLDNSVENNVKNFKISNGYDVKKFQSILFVPCSLERLKTAELLLGSNYLVRLFTN